jgi:hypothetical protein
MLQLRSRALRAPRSSIAKCGYSVLNLTVLTARGPSRYFAHSLSSPPSAELISWPSFELGSMSSS